MEETVSFRDWLEPARILIGTVGVLLLGFTTYWSLTNDKEAVALALVAVGFLFTYLGYTGQVLTSFKGPGGTEAAFARLAGALGQLLDDPRVPEDVKGEVAEDVGPAQDHLPGAVAQSVNRAQTARRLATEYERKVTKALQSISKDKDWTLTRGLDSPYDLLVTSREGLKVPVEIRWSPGPATPQQFARWRRALDAAGPHGFLITSSLPPQPSTSHTLRWASEQDTPYLEAALQEALRSAAQERVAP